MRQRQPCLPPACPGQAEAAVVSSSSIQHGRAASFMGLEDSLSWLLPLHWHFEPPDNLRVYESVGDMY